MNILFSISITTSSASLNASAKSLPASCLPSISRIPSWLSPIANSLGDANMPLLTTPRSSRASSTNGSSSTVLGTVAPGGNHATVRPARTFGAPHTTCTKPSSSRGTSLTAPLSSIRQTLSLSAFGCFSHEMTLAMIIPWYFGPSSTTSSTAPN